MTTRITPALAAALFAIAPLANAAQAPKPAKADNCAPPPSAIAPALPATLLEGMGTVHLPITTSSPEAQKFFDQGLAQMHSFWAREAERSFLQAAALDPKAPMPQWGVAMVAGGDWRPRFQIDLLEQVTGKTAPAKPSPAMLRARAAAAEAVELAAVPGAASDLEKLYVASIAARRNPDATDPDEAFAQGLRAVVAKYPNDIEGRLDLVLDGRDFVATPGDVIRLPMGIPHGIFNKSDQTVKCFFWVSPTRRLYDLFWAIHSMKDQNPNDVVALSARHEVTFLPPPPGA